MQIKLSYVFLLLLIGFGGLTFSQTKMIALKSHSGNPAAFDPAGQGNLGIVEPPPRLDSIVKINDSTVVRYMNNDFGPYYYDTLINDKQWLKSDLNLDSVCKYYDETAIIGFETQESEPTKKTRPPKLKRRKKLKETKEKNTLIMVGQNQPPQSKNYKVGLILGLFIGCLSLSFLIFRKRSVINV